MLLATVGHGFLTQPQDGVRVVDSAVVQSRMTVRGVNVDSGGVYAYFQLVAPTDSGRSWFLVDTQLLGPR